MKQLSLSSEEINIGRTVCLDLKMDRRSSIGRRIHFVFTEYVHTEHCGVESPAHVCDGSNSVSASAESDPNL